MELRMENLTKRYGEKYGVHGMNLRLLSGVYGLLGANGAGKTTLMRLLCGLEKPTEGRVLLNGKDIRGFLDKYCGLLGYLPQDFPFYGDFRAEDFLLYMASLKGLSAEMAKRRSTRLLCEVGLDAEKQRKIKTFSGGMKQRLGIAQAMLNNPRILILDEPTAGLDPKERVRFRNLISTFSKDRIVLLSTHIVSDVEYIADTIIMMKEGKLLHLGRAGEIASEISGLVWECEVLESAAEAMQKHFPITNLRNLENGSTVIRVISKEKPAKNAAMVSPNLEDLYLYYFGAEE
ncbi:MAG: ABC transporter ATP-binding protein [Eubacteriales bacterium]|nr:ABC transporter ATP-binding protein [Eubacteriales bacterium]